MGAAIDITNKRFGKLVALEPTDKRVDKCIIWKCKCDCGNIAYKPAAYLNKNRIVSCGCVSGKRDYGESSFNKLYYSYNYFAKRRGYEFKLSKVQFRELTKQNCYYCGAPPEMTYKLQGGFGEYIYNGVDRKNSKLNYTKRNTVACCKKCNIAKSDMSQKEFYLWVEKVYTNLQNVSGD